MTTGANACNNMRCLQQALTYHPGKWVDRTSYQTARPAKSRPLLRVNTIRTRPFVFTSCPIISSAASAGDGAEIQRQGGRKCFPYLRKHLKCASTCVHTSASASTALTTESSQIPQNTPQDAQSLMTYEHENMSGLSTPIGEVHPFQNDEEAEAMLWAYELWLKREMRQDKGESWTQEVHVSEPTTDGLYMHKESLDRAGKPSLFASVSAPTRVGVRG